MILDDIKVQGLLSETEEYLWNKETNSWVPTDLSMSSESYEGQ